MPAIDLHLVAHRFALDGSVERAAAQKSCLKSELDFFGVSVPVVRAALKQESKENPVVDRSDLLETAFSCFDFPQFESFSFEKRLAGRSARCRKYGRSR